MFRFICVLLLTGACVSAQSEDAVKKDLKLFQGSWKAISAQGVDGKPLEPEELKPITLVVDGDKFTLNTGSLTVQGTFSIDPTKKLKTIDMFEKNSPEKVLMMGIYEIKGDTRKSCFTEPGKDRPDGFRKEKGFIILEWKQDK